MANEIKYRINVQIADNTVTKDDTDDKIFTIVSSGTADRERVIAEMMAMNPGVEPEMMRLVLDLEKRAVQVLGRLPHAMREPSKPLGAFRTPCAGRPSPWKPSARHARAIQAPGRLPHAMRGPSKPLGAFRTPCAGRPSPWKPSTRHAWAAREIRAIKPL